MSKRLVTIAVLTTLATGCTGRAAILGGALTAGAGVAMLMSSQSGPGCACDDSSCQLGNDLVVAPIDAMRTTLGAITALAGTVLLLTGLATTDDRPAEVVRVPPTMTVMTGAPGSMLRGEYIVEEPIADALVVGEAPVPVRRALPAPRGPQDPRTAALRRQFPRVEAVSAWLEPRHQDEILSFGLELQLEALARASTGSGAA